MSCFFTSTICIAGNSKFFLMLFFGVSYYCLLIKKISSYQFICRFPLFVAALCHITRCKITKKFARVQYVRAKIYKVFPKKAVFFTNCVLLGTVLGGIPIRRSILAIDELAKISMLGYCFFLRLCKCFHNFFTFYNYSTIRGGNKQRRARN